MHEPVDNLRRWRPEFEVVNLARLGVKTATATTLNQGFVGHFDEKELLHLQSRISHCLSLVWRTREAIKKAALLLDVVLREAVLYEVHNQIAGHQCAGVHVLLCLLAELGAALDVL